MSEVAGTPNVSCGCNSILRYGVSLASASASRSRARLATLASHRILSSNFSVSIANHSRFNPRLVLLPRTRPLFPPLCLLVKLLASDQEHQIVPTNIVANSLKVVDMERLEAFDWGIELLGTGMQQSKITCEDVARQVLAAVKKDRLFVVTNFPSWSNWVYSRLYPERYYRALAYLNRKGRLQRFLMWAARRRIAQVARAVSSDGSYAARSLTFFTMKTR